VPGEFHQRAHCLGWRQVPQVQFALALADVGVGLLQHGGKQPLLVLEVVVDQPLVERSTLGDAVHARTAQAMLGKFVAGRRQDHCLRALGVALAFFGGSGFGSGHGFIHSIVNRVYPPSGKKKGRCRHRPSDISAGLIT